MAKNKLGEVVLRASGAASGTTTMIAPATNVTGMIVRTACAFQDGTGGGRAILFAWNGTSRYALRANTVPAVHLESELYLPPGWGLQCYVQNTHEWAASYDLVP